MMDKIIDKCRDLYELWFNWSAEKMWRRVLLCIIMVPVAIAISLYEWGEENMPALYKEVTTFIKTGK